MPVHMTGSKALSAMPRAMLILLLLALIAGCAIYASDHWAEAFGPAQPRDRMVTTESEAGDIYLHQVQPLLEKRCVVCHGCYDSPCQLNLAAPEGIDRGASKDKVYNGSRLRAAPLTRLFEDAQTTAQWRDRGFYPVLNEHQQTPKANVEASVMHHMLALKRKHPLPTDAILDDSFSLGLKREQECPKPADIDEFVEEKPLWGMPYALPGLSDTEFDTLEHWLKNGSPMAHPPALGPATLAKVERWEAFLNGDSLKQQLMSRYLFEHWFLAHLYFPELDDGEFFRIIRSATPPGEAISHLPSRRPYDDPGVERVYYRLWRDHSTVLDKTHMPYALGANTMQNLHELFLAPEYTVASLPSWEPAVAANPFIAFKTIPVESRWQFLLAEAQFTIMSFIKGPVCRGQVALNVVRDHFWVIFNQSKLAVPEEAAAFLNAQALNLRMPIQAGSNAPPIATWTRYSKSEGAYLKAKTELMERLTPQGEYLTLDQVWDGDGHNQNAALTIFRHLDSASVVKGLVGQNPKTALLIDFPILERIHYLLVAGYDVFGNMGHQLTSRLYMDFLRIEGEFNFLALLPPETRIAEREQWYEGASDKQKSYLFGDRASFNQPTGITYHSDNPKQELFGMLKQRLAPVLNRSYDLEQPSVPIAHREALLRMQNIKGVTLSTLPQVVFLNVQSASGEDHYYTLIRNNAHSNITSLFMEDSNLRPAFDTLTVVNNFIGSYPGALWVVAEEELPALVERLSKLSDQASYKALMDRYGIRRTAADFWEYSDKLMVDHHIANPIENGLLDYNRLENR